MKLRWVKLANGFHYTPTAFVQVGRHSSSGPVVVRTPAERDSNFEDGWRWSDVVDSERLTDAHFGNLQNAKVWVESHRLLLGSQTNWDYDGKPRLAPKKLTLTQTNMLRSVLKFGHPDAYLHGAAEHGGAARSRWLMTDQGLMRQTVGTDGGWELTDAGRTALETGLA